MIISTDAEKAFDKHPFKTKSQTRHKRKLPQHNKVHISKAHSQYYTQWCKTENLPSNIGTREGCTLSPFLFNIVLAILVRAFRQEKQMKASK